VLGGFAIQTAGSDWSSVGFEPEVCTPRQIEQDFWSNALWEVRARQGIFSGCRNGQQLKK
jgi:hypothetical protein